MGSKTTPTQVSGFLVPHPWSSTLAADRAVGTDYTEAEPQFGATTWSGTGRPGVALEVSGTPDSGVSALRAQVVTGGSPDGSAGVAWSSDGGTTYYGRDRQTLSTGYQGIRSTGRSVSVTVQASTGVLWLAFFESDGGTNWLYRVMSRTEQGVWGGLTTVLTIPAGSTTWAGCGITCAPDGSLLLAVSVPTQTGGLFQVDMYRSETGTTWRRLARRCGGHTDANPFYRISLAFSGSGSGMMLVNRSTGGGTNTTCDQFVSADGGATWATVGDRGATFAYDLIFANGVFVAIVGQFPAGADTFVVYRTGIASSKIFDATGVALATAVPVFLVSGACLAVDEIGVVTAYFTDETSGSLACYTSTDFAATFEVPSFGNGFGVPLAATAIVPGAGVAGRVQRGTTVLVSNAWIPAGAVSGGMYEIRGGGAASVTASVDITGWRARYVPTDSMEAYGWAATDTGAPTITLNYLTGQSIACGAGDTASRRYTDTETVAGHAGWFSLVARVTAGTLTFKAKVAGAGVLVDLTTTQIRAYDSTGAAGSYTNHAAGTDYVEVLVCVDYPRTQATVWYRVIDVDAPGRERAYVELIRLTGLGAAGADVHHWVSWAASTTALVLPAGLQFTPAGAPLISAGQAVADLQPLPVASATSSYAGAGASIRGLGGAAYPDGYTFTAAASSLYARENIDPRITSSPRRAWRSTGSSAAPLSTTVKLRHTLVPDTASTAQYLGSDLWAIWLDGLVGVPGVQIADVGGIITTLDLRQPLTYQAAGNSVRPTSAAGTTVTRPWVQPDELVGGYFQYATGDVRRIVRNTAGALTDTGTPGELRCTIYVEGVDGTEGTSGAGYIWPPRTLILWYLRGSHTVIQEYVELRLLSTSAIGPEGYRQIGVAAIGRVQVLGYGVDRSEARAQESGYDVQDMPDRSTVRTSRGPMRRTAEIALVDTAHDVQQVRGAGVSADYVVVSGNASAYPAASRFGDPLVLEGLVREVDGVPVVWLPQIPVESGSGADIVSYWRGWGFGALYGYLSPGRREQVQVGRTGVNDMYRYSTFTITEEV